MSQTIPTSLAPEVFVEEVGGSLQIKGWERSEIVVRANADDLTLESGDDSLRMSCRSDLSLRVPTGASLTIGQVNGGASIKLVDEDLSLGEVMGSLELRNTGTVQVATVHGHLEARRIAGDLQVEQVHGHLEAREIQGQLVAGQVGGSLDLRDIEAGIQASASGNARLRLSQIGGDAYNIDVQGNAHCRIPADADLELNLASGAEIIKVKLPEESKDFQEPSCSLTLGGGGAKMNLSADGMIFLSAEETEASEAEESGFGSLRGIPADFDQQISRQIESQIEAQMEAMSQQLNEQLANLSATISSAGFTQEQADKILQQARESSERATQRAQERMRRAQEKLERKIEAARRRNEMKAQAAERRSQSFGKRSWKFDWGESPAQDREPVSDEERLMILRMLEQKKITLEEAEQLLSALDDRE